MSRAQITPTPTHGVERTARQAVSRHGLQSATRAWTGHQGLRACDGYRYEFHIGKGTSLADKVVYRVEFRKLLRREAPPVPTIRSVAATSCSGSSPAALRR